jgi:hypothetical protein
MKQFSITAAPTLTSKPSRCFLIERIVSVLYPKSGLPEHLALKAKARNRAGDRIIREHQDALSEI